MVKCDIDGVIVRELKVHSDDRGWLMELFRHDEMPEEYHPVMAYVSMTAPGASRGPHEHRNQTDCFAFIGPSTFRLHLWDNRSHSATYGAKFTMEVGDKKPIMIIVPEGVVHAYTNVGEVPGLVYNAPNRLYAGQGRSGPVDEIRHEDDPQSGFKLEE